MSEGRKTGGRDSGRRDRRLQAGPRLRGQMRGERFVAKRFQLVLPAGVIFLAGLGAAALPGCGQQKAPSQGLSGAGPVVNGTPDDPLRDPREVHLRHIKQLTFGGQNAEGTGTRLVSTGEGKTTCGYFYPDGRHILYSSTHRSSPACPPRPDYSKGYVWGVYSAFQIFKATEGGEIVGQLTKGPGYNAEATFSTDGKKIVFTSARDGDLEIYSMNPDGSGARRLTWELGYDGGPFYSPNGNWIVYRAHHPSAGQEVARFKTLLAQELVEPLLMDLYVMRGDGSGKRQITRLDGASFAPSFFLDGQRIIFASNYQSPGSSQFELYAIDRDGTRLERITFAGGFNAFPVFSPDGKKLVFASNRNAKQPHEINIFVAWWVP